MFRSNTYNEQGFYTLVPLARQPVVPGQSVAIECDTAMESVAFLQNLLNGGVMEMYAFYTPYRLVWDEWMEFISEPDYPNPMPTTATAWPLLFERSGTVNALPRRMFKKIYNQYFGSDQFGDTSLTWYDDIARDTEVTLRRVRSAEQFAGKVFPSALAEDEEYDAPVTGTAPNQIASISLNEFRRAMNAAKSDRRSFMTGDKYVDAMRRMGVDLNWSMQMAPEFLGKAACEFESRETRANYTPADPAPAGSAVTGRAYARYATKCTLKTPRKFFSEHGLIWVLGVVRPHVWNKAYTAPQDAYKVLRQNLFLGDNQKGTGELNSSELGLAASRVYTPRFTWLRTGQNLVGQKSTTPWMIENTPSSLADYVYPSALATDDDDTLQNRMAFLSRYRGMGPTPVRANVL